MSWPYYILAGTLIDYLRRLSAVEDENRKRQRTYDTERVLSGRNIPAFADDLATPAYNPPMEKINIDRRTVTFDPGYYKYNPINGPHQSYSLGDYVKEEYETAKEIARDLTTRRFMGIGGMTGSEAGVAQMPLAGGANAALKTPIGKKLLTFLGTKVIKNPLALGTIAVLGGGAAAIANSGNKRVGELIFPSNAALERFTTSALADADRGDNNGQTTFILDDKLWDTVKNTEGLGNPTSRNVTYLSGADSGSERGSVLPLYQTGLQRMWPFRVPPHFNSRDLNLTRTYYANQQAVADSLAAQKAREEKDNKIYVTPKETGTGLKTTTGDNLFFLSD
jgi:hypothetical protein